jgi:hypothetical protein
MSSPLAVFVTASYTSTNEKRKVYEQHSASALLDSLIETIWV